MDVSRELVISPCQARCSWSTSGERLGEDLLFACEACGSEWVASEAWTPVDWKGVVPEAVQAERARQGGRSAPTEVGNPLGPGRGA